MTGRSERLGAKAIFWERPVMTYVIHNITLVIPNIHCPAEPDATMPGRQEFFQIVQKSKTI